MVRTDALHLVARFSLAAVISRFTSALMIMASSLASSLSTMAELSKILRPCRLRTTFLMTKRLIVLGARPKRSAILAALNPSSKCQRLARAISAVVSFFQAMVQAS